MNLPELSAIKVLNLPEFLNYQSRYHPRVWEKPLPGKNFRNR
jgi:hypothetical protein